MGAQCEHEGSKSYYTTNPGNGNDILCVPGVKPQHSEQGLLYSRL